ncbi:MAG: hypothetical protein BGP03_27840 [Pseudonocardia sp. 73-21]|nr:MAG: hypothetical protein BGP03_27840 [Pseudonocardia sp. 73-21]
MTMPASTQHHLDSDSTDALLTATGLGDLDAFAAFYDRTAATVFGMLDTGTQATERVYLSVWRAAPEFRPSRRSAYATLMMAIRRELADQFLRHGQLEA